MSNGTHITSESLTRTRMSHRIMRRSIIYIWWEYQNHFEDLIHHNHPLLQLIARVLLIVQWPDSFLCRTHFRASTASLPPCPQALGAKSFAAMMMTMMMVVMVMMTLVVKELMRRVHIIIIIMSGDFGRSLFVFMSDIPCLQPRVTTRNFNIDRSEALIKKREVQSV